MPDWKQVTFQDNMRQDTQDTCSYLRNFDRFPCNWFAHVPARPAKTNQSQTQRWTKWSGQRSFLPSIYLFFSLVLFGFFFIFFFGPAKVQTPVRPVCELVLLVLFFFFWKEGSRVVMTTSKFVRRSPMNERALGEKSVANFLAFLLVSQKTHKKRAPGIV